MMECNKDEALRAMEIAEKKFAVKDYAAAKKLLLKAQQLYPSFENVLRMLAVVEVHTIAQEKASGSEIDLYQLLQVDVNADDSTIKKSYRRLALMLHPDKNKSPGAEAAFKLIGEAWAVLSDKTKRVVYDSRRMLRGVESKLTSLKKEDGHQDVFQSQAPSRKEKCVSNNNVHTFWTSCPHCKMQYEYYRTYLNFNLKCQKCQKIFLARDIHDSVANGTNKTDMASGVHGSTCQAGSHREPAGSKFPGAGTAQGMASEAMNGAPTSQFGGGMPQTFSKKVEEDLPASRRETRRNVKQDMGQGYERKKEAVKKENIKGNGKRQQKIDVLLMKKNLQAKIKREEDDLATCKEVDEPQSGKRAKKGTFNTNQKRQKCRKEHGTEHEEESKKVNASQSSEREAATDSEMRQSCKMKRDEYKEEGEHLVASPSPKRQTQPMKGATAVFQKKEIRHDDDAGSDDLDGLPIPDSDFHDFGQDRSKTTFDAGQFWALYDEFDGMPRFYCHIISVLKTRDFAVRMKWLEALPESKSSYGNVPGFSPPCGKFRCAKGIVTEKEINVFSHMMMPEVDGIQPIKIYPRSGEIWALFSELGSHDFKTLSSDQIRSCKYEITEVLTKFSEGMGVNIVSLVKVDGYKTVFARKSDATVQWLPSSELSRFSHLVPAWKIVGKGVDLEEFVEVWDLDPASLSPDLLKEAANETVDS